MSVNDLNESGKKRDRKSERERDGQRLNTCSMYFDVKVKRLLCVGGLNRYCVRFDIFSLLLFSLFG